jgi:hypothetical protein
VVALAAHPRDDLAEIASAAALDYRPRMHARHGQGAAAAQARPPRSKLSDFLHVWVNNIRLFYTWSNVDNLGPPQLPVTGMGNLQSDSKKKQRKKENALLPASTSVDEPDTFEDRKKDQKPRDQPANVHDGHDDIRESIKISFEKMPGHAKRQAPQPPKILLTKVLSLFSYVQIELNHFSLENRHRDAPFVISFRLSE